MVGFYLNDDFCNGVLMVDIGGLLVGLCVVKGYIFFVGGSMLEVFWYYIGCM